MSEMTRKLTSRKWWMACAAFLASFAMGVTGIMPAEWCAVCMAASAGIYAACEAYVDGANAKSTTTVTNISAASDDRATVAALLTPAPEEEQAE